jgi:hypothetical protein
LTRYPCLLPDQIDGLLNECHCALDAAVPGLGVGGVRLLNEHGPAQWPVEWHLPWWLAASLGLAEADWRALTVCNLLGLGYVRIQDRLAEGEGTAAASDAVLAAACYELALAELARLFPATPTFWQYRRLFMAHWLRALCDDQTPISQPFDAWQEQDLAALAWRGAPLKISAAGACLLANRGDLIPTLTDALDQLLIAQVLLDHVDDWREDLSAGRFNAFVAYATDCLENSSPLGPVSDRARRSSSIGAPTGRRGSCPQDENTVEANRRRVLALLMMGDPGSYFQLVQRYTARAGSLAAQAGCSGLAEFAASLQSEADLGCGRLVAAARSQLQQAVAGAIQV